MAWLTGTPAALAAFIAAMISVPASVVTGVQLVSNLSKITRRGNRAPGVELASGLSALDAVIYDRHYWRRVGEHLESTGRFSG
jgi:hypothetical protein